MEVTLAPEQLERIVYLTAQLGETLMTAAILADEIRSTVQSELDRPATARAARNREADLASSHRPRPFVDDSTLSVIWAGKACHLRNTVLFRLARRLARQPNQYIAADRLLCDVWEGGVKSPDTIRSAARNLRKRFVQAGMDDLAAAIRASGGRYGLILDGRV